jgi:peptidoglycan/LPS O-acetylase OafA/YrhL
MKFRYDINALRAIAVIGVMLFHYGFPHIYGGFAGVDVFFVISGYLMTQIITGSLQKDNFSLKEFYIKRLKRIVPALLVLVAVITVLGFFIYFPVDYTVTERNCLASILFVSNMVYWKTANYFAAASDTNILLHTWSLSVEWQFYLVYPVILVWLNRLVKNKKVYLWIFSGATLFICLTSILFTKYYATASFYWFPSRSWEMLAGGITFYAKDIIQDRKKKIVLALSGYALIAYSMLFFNRQIPWPGIYTLIPVIATCMVIIANRDDIIFIKSGIAQFFGRISYSLYLWHWPVLVLALYVGSKGSKAILYPLIILPIGLAYLSYRYIESVVYNSPKRILICMGIFSVAAVLLLFTNVNSLLFKPESLQLSAYAKDHKIEMEQRLSAGKCFITDGYTIKDFNHEQCLCLNDSFRNILLIGDSHAAHLLTSLKETFSKMGIQLSIASASHCMPVLGIKEESTCSDVINYVYHDYIVKHATEIDGIIISADWLLNTDDPALLKDIVNTLHFLEQYHLKTIIIGQNETYIIPYPNIAAWERQLNMKLAQRFVTKRSVIINDFLKDKLKSSYVNIFNSNFSSGVSSDNVPYMFDGNHVSSYGADLIVQKILKDSVASKFLQAVMN